LTALFLFIRIPFEAERICNNTHRERSDNINDRVLFEQHRRSTDQNCHGAEEQPPEWCTKTLNM